MIRLLPNVLKYVALSLAIVLLVLTLHVARTWDRQWEAPLPDIHASNDAEVIRRGEYLVFGPAHCVDCHGSSSGGPESLSGGMPFAVAPLGAIYAKNLTPDPETGIGRYSDGQLARVLRYAVLPDGRATVQPLMPYGEMSDEDVEAIVSFLRAQPPARHRVPQNRWTLIGKVVKSLSPAFRPRTNAHAPKVAPPEKPTRERGAYLARAVGNCGGCHSPANPLTFRLNGPEFSGGARMEPRDIAGVDRTLRFQPPNLTPLAGSGIRRFPDRETFVARFQKGGRKDPASPMPWECFGRMTAEDAAALYEYFMSLPAGGVASPSDVTASGSGG